ncbi:hypothetical protein BGW80DRAFT_1500548 [Lactifluus volemus]|nr:hypothetical protein BGW80DRAFT_1500548 [Lactifluus volemus]
MMQLLSRITSLHQLTILGFYTYILKYLTHHQLRAPAILALLARPCMHLHHLTSSFLWFANYQINLCIPELAWRLLLRI